MHKRTIILMSSTLAACVAAIALLWLPVLSEAEGVGGGLSASAAPAAELHVCPSGCTYSSVQTAVDVANTGDVIKVAQGDYTDIHVRAGITQVVYISKTVTVRGGYTTSDWNTSNPIAHPTTLDAQGQGRVLVIVGDISPNIEGLRLTGGVTLEPLFRGGGLYVENAGGIISGNVIYSNTASYYGGGVYLSWSSARLVHNTIENNTASTGVGSGGGLYLSCGAPTLEDNIIQNNAALSGGGVHLFNSNATLTGNTIANNTAGQGGGVEFVCSSPTLTGNLIKGNTASAGSGLYLFDSEPTLINNAIIDNKATWRSGICVTQGSAPRLIHNTIARNGRGAGGYGDGSGIYVTDDLDYPGAGIASTIAMTNTIIFSHTVGITVTAGNIATLNATLWHANGVDYGDHVIHSNDHSGDPYFAADGYHLLGKPGAIDQGVDAGVTTDIDGDARPIDAAYDIGADETAARYFIYLPLVLR